MKLASFILLACATTAFSAEIGSTLKHYHGYQVFRTQASTKQQRDALIDLQQKGEFDFWSEPSIVDSTDIMASSKQISSLISFLEKNGIQHSVMIDDVETLVASERKTNMNVLRTKQQGRISWNAYYSYADIMEWVDSLPALYPDLVTVASIGSSYEGRDMKVVKVSKNSGKEKVSMFFDGGFHAREWISPATVTYFLNDILENQADYSDILDVIDFHIVPIVNVDGYEYSRTETRMWRKTRSNHNSTCRGVDPNRNFNYHFGESGTSNDRCSDIYRGPEPFSEIEAANLRDYILGLRDTVDWQVYITVHSYGQWILIPWSYRGGEYPPGFDQMLSLAQGSAADLTAMYGTRYVVGQSADTLSPTAGCSDDWAKSEGIFYSYTFELRDTGRYGFVLPPEYIIPTAKETVAGFKHICNHYVTSGAAKTQ